MLPKVSIVVPIYKVPENFLVQCIESCIHQTLESVEIILVDDGSPDDCGKICDKYAQTDSRIKVIHKANGGLVSARNAGYDVAIGEWQMYVDGDDWLDLDCCEKLIQLIDKYPNVDVIFWKCVQELGSISIPSKWELPNSADEFLYEGNVCKDLARHTLIYKSGIATAYNKLIRSSFAKENNLKHDDSLRQGSEGLEFSFRVFHFANRALSINQCLYHYRYNADSISKKVDEKNTDYLTDCFRVIEKDVKTLADDSKEYKVALYQRVVYMLIAIAMGTYFHPANKESLFARIKKYRNVINNFDLYKQSIAECPTTGMDKLRRITLLFIRMKLYFMLELIAKAKQFMLKRGKFNY